MSDTPGTTEPPESMTPPAPARAKRSGGLARVAFKNATSVIGMRLSGVAVTILITPIVLHALGSTLYGVAQATNSIYEYMSLMRGGMNAALRRFVTLSHHAGKREAANRYYAVGFWWSTLLRAAILLLGLGFAAVLCDFFRVPEELRRDGAIGIALLMVATVLADQAQAFEIPIYATGRTAPSSILRIAVAWLRLGITFAAFAFLAPTLTTYGGVLVVVEAIPLIGLYFLATRTGVVRSVLPKPDFGDAPLRREMFAYGGYALLAHAAALLYTSADNLMIGRIYGADQVTHYSLGTRWAPLILSFLTGSIQSLTPLFTELEAKGEIERARAALLRVVKLTTAIAVPCCLVPCVVGDLFLVKWVGEDYRKSALYMIAMLAPSTLEVALAPVWMAMLAKGRIAWIAIGDIIVAVGNVALSLFLGLGLGLGLLGFALGNTAALLAKNLLLRPMMGRRDPSLPSTAQFLAPLPLALLGGAPGLVLLYLARPWISGSMVAIVVASALAVGVSAVGSLLLAAGPSAIRELKQRLVR